MFLMMFMMVGCGICKRVQYVPVETKIDSVVIEKRVEVEKEVPVEVEVPVKYVPDYYKWINIIFWCIAGTGFIFVIFKMKVL